jgi:prolyl 4-hydroxylase
MYKVLFLLIITLLILFLNKYKFLYFSSKYNIEGHSFFTSKEYNNPLIISLYPFLSKSECKYIIELSKYCLKRSTVTNKKRIQNSRTSNSCFLGEFINDKVINKIKRRIVRYLNINPCQLEDLQVLRYKPGQKYDFHYDWFNNTDEDSKKELARGGQRLYTIFVYLNDLSEIGVNGSTCFKKIDYCTKPKEGLGIFWRNMVNGNVDYNTLHAGMAPLNSYKFGMNIWVREKCFK